MKTVAALLFIGLAVAFFTYMMIDTFAISHWFQPPKQRIISTEERQIAIGLEMERRMKAEAEIKRQAEYAAAVKQGLEYQKKLEEAGNARKAESVAKAHADFEQVQQHKHIEGTPILTRHELFDECMVSARAKLRSAMIGGVPTDDANVLLSRCGIPSDDVVYPAASPLRIITYPRLNFLYKPKDAEISDASKYWWKLVEINDSRNYPLDDVKSAVSAYLPCAAGH